MTYILIFIFVQFQDPGAVGSVEFNTLGACQAAAAELRKQAVRYDDSVKFPAIICAEKGKKP